MKKKRKVIKTPIAMTSAVNNIIENDETQIFAIDNEVFDRLENNMEIADEIIDDDTN